MSVSVKSLHIASDRDALRLRPAGRALAVTAAIVGLALSAAAALAQAETSPSFPPPSDFLDGQVGAKGAPLPPTRPVQAKPDGDDIKAARAKRPERLTAEPRPARRTAKLAYAPSAADAWRDRGNDACRRPAIIIDDYWRGGPIIDCRGGFRAR